MIEQTTFLRPCLGDPRRAVTAAQFERKLRELPALRAKARRLQVLKELAAILELTVQLDRA